MCSSTLDYIPCWKNKTHHVVKCSKEKDPFSTECVQLLKASVLWKEGILSSSFETACKSICKVQKEKFYPSEDVKHSESSSLRNVGNTIRHQTEKATHPSVPQVLLRVQMAIVPGNKTSLAYHASTQAIILVLLLCYLLQPWHSGTWVS